MRAAADGGPEPRPPAKNMARQLTSEIERNPQLAKSFFLLLEVALPDRFKAVLCAKVLQEGIYSFQQFRISLADANRPELLLNRVEHCAGGVRVALPILVGGHLVINERVSLLLDYFKNAGGFLV